MSERWMCGEGKESRKGVGTKGRKRRKKQTKIKCEYGDRTSDHSGWEMYRIVAVQGVYFNRC